MAKRFRLKAGLRPPEFRVYAEVRARLQPRALMYFSIAANWLAPVLKISSLTTHEYFIFRDSQRPQPSQLI